MKTKLYIHILLPVIMAGIIVGCSSTSKDKGAQLEALKAEQVKIANQIVVLEAALAKENPEMVTVRAKEVGVSELSTRTFDHYVQTQGRVEAEDDINVSAKAMGVVTNVYVNEGDKVSAGQILAQIDNKVIVTGIAELKSQLNLVNTVFERQKNLWEQKIGTEVQYLQAKTNKESMEKRLASLNEQNEMTRIKSPISGFADAVYVKSGQNIAPGLPAVHIVNFSDLKIKANISEAYSTAIHKGDKAMVMVSELNKEIEARVTFVGKTIDPLSRTFVVEVKLPTNPDLRPNMTGVVKVVYLTENAALVVPVNAVQTVNNEKIVYVAEKDGNNTIARKRVVTISDVFNNMTHVKSGLSVGEKIITFGYQGLNDGEVIKM